MHQMLGDLCDVVGGGTSSRKNEHYFNGDIPWVRPLDVVKSQSLFIETTSETITEAGLHSSSARRVPSGSVLLTSRATIGYTAVAKVPLATNQGMTSFIIQDDRIIPEYLALWLFTQEATLSALAGGTTFKELRKATLKGLNIPLPPIELQRDIAVVCKAWDVYHRMSKSYREMALLYLSSPLMENL